LLEAVSPIKGEALHEVMHRLIEAELIHRRGSSPKTSYAFKHALVRDVAYDSLLRSRRQRIHAHIAWALKQHLTDEEYAPATIAHHYTEAGLADQAAQGWLTAAEFALSQSTAVEAERHASTGLSLIADIEASAARDALELGLLVARAAALWPLKSISAPETFAALMAAKRLLDRGIGTDLQRVSVLYGLSSSCTIGARLTQARDFAQQIIDEAKRHDDPNYLLVGYRVLGTLQFYAGNHRDALATLENAYALREARRQKTLSAWFGWDQGIAVRCYEVLTRLSLGLFDSSAALAEQVRAELLSHGHATTVASAQFCVTIWPQFARGDFEALERDSAELGAYCTDKKVEQIRLLTGLLGACASAVREPTESRIAAIRNALEALRQSGGNAGNSIILSNIAEALLLAGDLAGAQSALNDGFAFVAQSGESYWLADLHRLEGRIAVMQPAADQNRAEACFAKAIAVAQSQEARLLELRAATDLVRLRRGTAPAHELRALLQPVLAAIEGGENVKDVRDARNLLAILA
jgi:predicted ATPase